jgi:hypothetical protein
MALPRKLKNMNLFVDGDNWQGLCEEFTPAKLTKKFEKYRGGGMAGAVGVDMGYEDDALNTEFTLGGFEVKALQKHSAAKHNAVLLRFAGSFQRDDTGEISAVEIVQRGRIKEMDNGNYKVGDNSTMKVSMENSYYKVTVDNEVIIEIDTVNMVEIVNGEDMMAAHRTAIGL